MDYKFIEQLVERYFEAQTTLQEEEILRIFFSQEELPAGMEAIAALFAMEQADRQVELLSDDFDARMLEMIQEESPVVKARTISITQKLVPLFKAAAMIAIILTLGNAAQAPWDKSWQTSEEYAAIQQADTVVAVSPVQAENISDVTADSSKVMMTEHPTD